jgi:WD40 repeat protein
MTDSNEFELNQVMESKVRSAFPTQDPDQLFIDSLEKKLADRFKNLEKSPVNNKNPKPSPRGDRFKPLLSTLAWGSAAVILLLVVVWGIRNLIPGYGPIKNIQSTPSPQASPTKPGEPTQPVEVLPEDYQPTLIGMPVPWPEEAITSANAARVTELARWGKGSIGEIAWAPDGKYFAVTSPTGIYMFDAVTLEEIKIIASGAETYVIAFSPDGTILASGASDFTIKLWDVASGNEIRSLVGHTNFIGRLAFSPKGDLLVSMAYEQPVKLWDVASGRELYTLDASSGARSIAISPDGGILAVTGFGEAITLWDLSSGTELRTISRKSGGGSEDGAASVAFSPDGKLLASGYDKGMIVLWDAATWEELQSLTGSPNGIYNLAFSPDGTFLASNTYDEPVKLWDIASGKEHGTLGENQNMWYQPFSSDGKIISSSGFPDGTITVWDAASGKELSTLEWASGGGSSIAISPDGKMLASGTSSGSVSLFDVTTGQLVRTWQAHTGDNIYTIEVKSIAFSPDGTLLASGSLDSTKLWDVASGKELSSMVGQQLGWGGGPPCVTFSPDGKILAFGAKGGQVILWDVVSNSEMKALGGEPGEEFADGVTGVAFSPDGKTLVSGYDRGSIAVWDVSSGELLQTLTGHVDAISNNPVFGLVFTQDGKYLISGSRNMRIKYWDTRNWSESLAVNWASGIEGMDLVSLSLKGNILASGGWTPPIALWDTSNGEILSTLAAGASSIVFTPDGYVMVSATSDGVIRLWGILPTGVKGTAMDDRPRQVIIPTVQVVEDALPDELGIEKIPIPILLTGENIQPGEWSPDGSYFYYSQQGTIGEPGPDQAVVTISFLKALSGETCEGVQETVKMVDEGWGAYPEGVDLYARVSWLNDGRFMYLSPSGELLAITPCSDSIENWSESLPEQIASLGWAADGKRLQYVLTGTQGYYLFTSTTRQNVKLDLPAPTEGMRSVFGWSPGDGKLISSRTESRQGVLWIILESLDLQNGKATLVYETRSSEQLAYQDEKTAYFEWLTDHELYLSDTESGMVLINISSLPAMVTNFFPDLFGIEEPPMGSITSWGIMHGTGNDDNHLMVATGMASEGQYYIYHPETGLVDQYPLDPPIMVVYPGGEGGVIPSFVDNPQQKNTFQVIRVDSGLDPVEVTATGHTTGQASWSFATMLPDFQQVMFHSIDGISIVDLASDETKSFWVYEGQEQYQDIYAYPSPDGKTVVSFGMVNDPGKGYRTPAMFWLRLEP